MSDEPKDSDDNKTQIRDLSKDAGESKTQVKAEPDPDEKETLLRQEMPNDDKTNIRPKPSDISELPEDTDMLVRQANAKTVLREPAEAGEPAEAEANMTILREPVEAEPENVTVLRPPIEVETLVREDRKKAPDAPTEQVSKAPPPELTDEDITVVPEVESDDDTFVPEQDDDSTVVPGGTTRPLAPQGGGGAGAKGGGSEAGRLLKNRYVLEQKIGSGGMADVYKALDLRQQEAKERDPYIAIKILNDRFAQHRDAFLSLQREATRTRGIPHPNIMGVYDFDKEGDTIFMSMELLSGKPMDDWLKEHKEDGVPREDAFRVIDDICKGLGRAHDAGIIHSDFKPGNIYYCEDGSAKVFDFGIARLEGEDEDEFDAGTLGALTPTYASYEMLKGLTPSKSDDVYAVALTAYELLTGKHPFDRVSADKAFDREMKLPVIPWMKRRHMKALAKALEFKNEDRTQSLDEFREGLFSEDPPYVLYSGIAAAFALVVGFGIFQTLNVKEVPEEVGNIKGDFVTNSTNINTLLGTVDNLRPDDWNFQSEVWRNQLDTNILSMKWDNIQLRDDHGEWVEEVELEANEEEILAHQNQVMEAYVAEMKKVRVQAQQTVLDPEDKLQVEDALVLLAQSNVYLGITQARYNFDVDKIESEADALGTATNFRQFQLDTIIRKAEEAVAAADAAEKAETARQFAQQEYDEKNAEYKAHLDEFRDILRCKGEIVPEKLEVLGETIEGFREYPERFKLDRDGFTAALRGCITQRIAVRRPDEARHVQAVVATYLPEDADIFASIEIIDLDPCAARGLEGKGIGGRNTWCMDKLATGGTGPEMVVIPQKIGLLEGIQVVEIPKFATSRLEVRIGDYNQYCEAEGCSQLAGQSDIPATNISFDQAQKYLAWLSDQSGELYRLPTRKEWLYAAATDKPEEIAANINCTVDSRGVRLGENLQKTQTGRPNRWGLFHYVGNAREWAISGDDIFALGGAHTDPRPECTLTKSVQHSGQADPVTGFRIIRQFKTKPEPSVTKSVQQSGRADPVT